MKKIFGFFRRFWWLIVLGFVVGGFFAYNANASQAKAVKAKSYKVTRQNLVDALTLSGSIDAMEKADLNFQTSGLLTWVGVKEGDYVKKFQVIASLDQRALKNQISQLLNTYMTNRWTFEQAQQDNKDWQTQGMTDTARDTIRRTMEKYQFSLNNAVLNVEAEDITLKFANLWTPIEGLVTMVESPVAGQNVTPAGATFEVVNPKTIFFSALADQTEVTKYKVGQKAEIVLDSYPDKKISGTVASIAFTPKAGETGTVYELKIVMDLDNSDYGVRMGMTGDANFTFKEIDNVLVVPETYIKTTNGISTVTKLVDDKMVATEVKTGLTIDGQTEIVSGLNENDVIYSN